MKKLVLVLLVGLWTVPGVGAVESLCGVTGETGLSAYALENLAKMGATVRIGGDTKLSSYAIGNIGRAAKSAKNGGEVVLCASSKTFSSYQLEQMLGAGVKILILD